MVASYVRHAHVPVTRQPSPLFNRLPLLVTPVVIPTPEAGGFGAFTEFLNCPAQMTV